MENGMVWVNEGSVLNDAGHMILTSYIDLRKPEDRTPITGLVRGCERKYALEDCETIMISTPARYRAYGEELILDVQEGLAKEETVIASQETAAHASRQRAVSDLNQALELLDSNIRPTYRESRTQTNKDYESLTYGKEWWVLCTSIKPDGEEWDNWRDTLPDSYDHVSEIGQPAKFAQALAHMVAEQIGPRGQDGSRRDTSDGAETEKTTHKTQWVMHGPVVYTDSVYHALDGITDNNHRMAALLFTKGRKHAAQKEYRFVVLNEGDEEETVILQISGMMRDALKQTEHGLIRHPPVPLNTCERPENAPHKSTYETSKPIVKRRTTRLKSAEREEWKFEVRGSDGEVLSSDTGLRESVKEKTVTQDQVPERNELEMPAHVSRGHLGTEEDTLSIPDPLGSAGDGGKDKSDEELVKELSLEEFEFSDQDSEDDRLAIPVKTVTGRVYKSFEEMLNDPTYPMSPMGKVWQEDANTPDEITKTYRAIAVLDMKMRHLKSSFGRT